MAQVTRLIGVASLMRKFDRHNADLARGAQKGLKRGGVHLLGKSLAICPVDKGPLHASGHVRSEGSGFQTVVTVGYGGNASEYAVIVHEDLTKAHGDAFNNKHAAEIQAGTEHARKPEEQAKFLERPAREEHPVIADIIETSIISELHP